MNISVKIRSVLLFVLCVLLTAGYPFLANGETTSVKPSWMLDAHLHYNGPEESTREASPAYFGYRRFIKENHFQKAFLISPSYHVSRKLTMTGSFYQNESEIESLDRATSIIAQQYPDRFVGLCGLNLDWSESEMIQRVTTCLTLPGMKGVKVHSLASRNEQTVKDHRVHKNLKQLLSVLAEQQVFVLWHLRVDIPVSLSCVAPELTEAFSFAHEFPSITFIFAHSFLCENVLTEFLILEKGKGSRLENVFAETSNTYFNSANAWKEFGWDRVIFGSDNRPSGELKNLSQRLKLTPEQIHQITNITPKKLFDQIGIK